MEPIYNKYCLKQKTVEVQLKEILKLYLLRWKLSKTENFIGPYDFLFKIFTVFISML